MKDASLREVFDHLATAIGRAILRDPAFQSDLERHVRAAIRDALRSLPTPVAAQAPPPHLLRMRDVCARVGVSRTTMYRMRQTDGFPPSRRIGSLGVGWLASEIDDWIRSRPAR